jgi:hypothetical protein
MEVEGSAGVGVAAQERGASDGTAVEVPPLAAALLLLYCCFTSAFTAALLLRWFKRWKDLLTYVALYVSLIRLCIGLLFAAYAALSY